MNNRIKSKFKFAVSLAVTIALLSGSGVGIVNAVKASNNEDIRVEIDEFKPEQHGQWYDQRQGETVHFTIRLYNHGDENKHVSIDHEAYKINPTENASGECTYVSNGHPFVAADVLNNIIHEGRVAVASQVLPLCPMPGDVGMVQSRFPEYDQNIPGVVVPKADPETGEPGEKVVNVEYVNTKSGYFQDDFHFTPPAPQTDFWRGNVRRVAGNDNQSMTIDKQVSKTLAGGYSDEVLAKSGDDIYFKITATNPASSYATEVFLGDIIADSATTDNIVNGEGFMGGSYPAFDNDNLTEGILEVYGPDMQAIPASHIGDLDAGGTYSQNIWVEVADIDNDGIPETLVWRPGHFNPGQSVTFYVKTKIANGVQAAHLENSGFFYSDHTNPNYGIDTASVNVGPYPIEPNEDPYPVKPPKKNYEIVEDPGATIQKLVSDSNDEPQKSIWTEVNDTLVYDIVVENTGNRKLKNSKFMDDYDERYVEIKDIKFTEDPSVEVAPQVSDNGKVITIDPITLVPGEKLTVKVRAKVKSSLPPNKTVINNIAEFVSDPIGSIESEAEAIVGERLDPAGVYLVTDKALDDVNGANVEPGDLLRYTVSVENQGNAAAKNVKIADHMPKYVHGFKVVELPSGAKDDSNQKGKNGNGYLNVEIDKINPGEKASVVYEVTVDNKVPDGAKIKNAVVVNADEGVRSEGRVAGTVGKPAVKGTTGGRVLGAADNVPTGPVEDMIKWILAAVVMGFGGLFSLTKFVLPVAIAL